MLFPKRIIVPSIALVLVALAYRTRRSNADE